MIKQTPQMIENFEITGINSFLLCIPATLNKGQGHLDQYQSVKCNSEPDGFIIHMHVTVKHFDEVISTVSLNFTQK